MYFLSGLHTTRQTSFSILPIIIYNHKMTRRMATNISLRKRNCKRHHTRTTKRVGGRVRKWWKGLSKRTRNTLKGAAGVAVGVAAVGAGAYALHGYHTGALRAKDQAHNKALRAKDQAHNKALRAKDQAHNKALRAKALRAKALRAKDQAPHTEALVRRTATNISLRKRNCKRHHTRTTERGRVREWWKGLSKRTRNILKGAAGVGVVGTGAYALNGYHKGALQAKNIKDPQTAKNILAGFENDTVI
jgi:hypothetical protein